MPIFGAKSRAARGCASKLACGRRIGPLGSYEFAEDYRKNGAICRADVGIGPYTETSGAYVCAVFFHKKALLPAGRTESSARSRQLRKQNLFGEFELHFPV